RSRSLRQAIEFVDLIGFERLEPQVPLGQCLNARRTVQRFPSGAQRGDRVVFALDLRPQPGDALGADSRVEFDFVNIGGGRDQSGDDDEMQKPHHGRDPRISSSLGSRSIVTISVRADAWVRSPARSLAERARWFAAISAASGTTGRLVRLRNVAGAPATG